MKDPTRRFSMNIRFIIGFISSGNKLILIKKVILNKGTTDRPTQSDFHSELRVRPLPCSKPSVIVAKFGIAIFEVILEKNYQKCYFFWGLEMLNSFYRM